MEKKIGRFTISKASPAKKSILKKEKKINRFSVSGASPPKKSILKREKKIGRFKISNIKYVKFNKNPVKDTTRIPNNDCPKNNRPRLTKEYLDYEEFLEDMSNNVFRKKKYSKKCKDPNSKIYTTKYGFECCKKKSK